MKMVKISRVIGNIAKKFMVLVWVGASLLGNNTAAAGEKKSDKPAVIRHKTVLSAHQHKAVVPHKEKRQPVLLCDVKSHPHANAHVLHMQASHYADFFHGKKMANGKKFNMWSENTVAHKTLPLGTKLLLTNPDNGKQLTVEVKDRGPFKAGRDIDLALGVNKYLGLKEGKHGTATVTVVVIKKG